jgi:hypothetical protein
MESGSINSKDQTIKSVPGTKIKTNQTIYFTTLHTTIIQWKKMPISKYESSS